MSALTRSLLIVAHDVSGWTLISSAPNPWGQVPMTAGGQSLTLAMAEYRDRLLEQQHRDDPPSRRHHYVPATYLRNWSSDSKRVLALNTQTGDAKRIGVKSACVEEDFYRVVGPTGEAHNRVELLFGVVDTELQRVLKVFNELQSPETLEFDDLLRLGVTVAVQRMRTLQQRRLIQQQSEWLVAQNSDDFRLLANSQQDPHLVAGYHTELLFKSMWESADVMTTRQIEVWEDSKERFVTCDAPVLLPFKSGARWDLISSPYVAWPISPRRAVVLTNDLDGSKAIMRTATTRMVESLRGDVIRGRELMIFATEDQLSHLPVGSRRRRRSQVRLRCSQRRPGGEYVEPPGCCVQFSEGYGETPDIRLCQQGLHQPAPGMLEYI